MQEGATKEDIDQLTKFKFRKVGESEKHNFDEEQAQGDSGGVMTECGTDSPLEHTLSREDTVSNTRDHLFFLLVTCIARCVNGFCCCESTGMLHLSFSV